MSKYKYYYKNKKDREYNEQMAFASVIFGLLFIFYFSTSFISNCVFEWPIRWDVKTCWVEQIHPAKEKATEKAVNFVP